MTEETVYHPLFARLYLRSVTGSGARKAEPHRRRLLDGLSGEVLEVGAGSGANFACYPGAVNHVLAVEPEPRLRAEAMRAATQAPVAVDVVNGVAAALPAKDESVDGAVASLVLCSVADPAQALAEIRRVLRPGGELRFYEHVAARQPVAAALQRLADATVWPRIAGNCHMARDTPAMITAAGFTIERCDRFLFSQGPAFTAVPHILGTARRPG